MTEAFDSLFIACLFIKFGPLIVTIWTSEISTMLFPKNAKVKSIFLKNRMYQ